MRLFGEGGAVRSAAGASSARLLRRTNDEQRPIKKNKEGRERPFSQRAQSSSAYSTETQPVNAKQNSANDMEPFLSQSISFHRSPVRNERAPAW